MTTALTATIDTLITNLEALLSSVEAPYFNDPRIIAQVQTLLTQLNLDTSTINERVTYQFLQNPDAATTTASITQKDLNTVSAGFTAVGPISPDYPRNMNLTTVLSNGTITTMTVVVTGLGIGGIVQTETFTCVADATYQGNLPFMTVTSVICTAVTGTGGVGDTLDAGEGVKFGIIPSTPTVVKTIMDDDDVAVAGHTISAANQTITFATAPNATHDYHIWALGRA